MLKFVLRIFVVLAVGFVISNEVVDRSANFLISPVSEAYQREAVRGQIHSLLQELSPIDPDKRQEFLDTVLKPHYGLGLRVVDAGAIDLSDKDRKDIEAGGFAMRDKMQTYIAAIPGAGRTQWLEMKLPPEPSIGPWVLAGVYSALGLLLCGFMMVWALPIWRDLEALKGAALRMGQGDLQARARLSRHSSIRSLGDTFNQMSERIATLVGTQRELTNAVSHELRTPIARLAFELDMMENESDPQARQHLIDEMKSDVAELDGMASELLMYARLEHKEGHFPLQALDARGMLDGVVQHAGFEAGLRNVHCVVAACDVQEVRMHQRYMTRALLNLLQNAIRYADKAVQVSLSSPAVGHYVLTVDDDGPGIEPSDRERIFEPFIRLDESRDRNTGGTGLGLAIVSRVARWHNGTVECTASPLGGARFMIRWQAT